MHRDLQAKLDRLLTPFGLAEFAPVVMGLLVLLVVIVLAWLVARGVRFLAVRALKGVASRTRSSWDDALVEHRVVERLTQLLPAIAAYLAAGLVFGEEAEADLQSLVQRLAVVWAIVVLARATHALFDTIGSVARQSAATRDKPIRGYLQVAAILLWLATGVVVVATLLDRSPWALLGGLGAMTAILMLVFRDSILGFVASIQIASYDLVRVGEWIEIPKYGADGDVVDVSLHTVRVQNWDKTIVTVPTTALLSEGFKNWRGMSLSGGRRVKRSLAIDMTSVRFLSEDEIERLSDVQTLRPYLDGKRHELAEWNERQPEADVLGQRRLTNLGTYRAYLEAYLRAHPEIHDQMTFLVRQLAPSAEGLPLEVYVFSREQRWAHYEALMADLFDHFVAVAPLFGLRLFQHPTGTDVREPVEELARALRPAVRGGASREASETPPTRRDRSATKPGSASIGSPS
ncbi:MAG TPA: mechanosensitive ion channel domain-containing protein [Thermoanaerobaculia bacterium]|nr:mechanosensitive ion channel domain-containing protein [Thermoanaerobaculia bacterium]